MYVSEICAEGVFITFPLWLKNVKSRSKIALFSNKRHFEIWFPKKKKKNNTFFWSKLSKLHKKDPILQVATTFSLKQGETRTSHGPIPHPLIMMYTLWVVTRAYLYKYNCLTSISGVTLFLMICCIKHWYQTMDLGLPFHLWTFDDIMMASSGFRGNPFLLLIIPCFQKNGTTYRI